MMSNPLTCSSASFFTFSIKSSEAGWSPHANKKSADEDPEFVGDGVERVGFYEAAAPDADHYLKD